MDYSLIIGIVGILILLVGFIIEHIKIKNYQLIFNVMNVIGSLFLAVYAIYKKDIIFIVLQFIWAGISIFYIIKKE